MKISWLLFSSFFVFNLFPSTGQSTKPITLTWPSEKLSLTTTLAACLAPRSPHIFNRTDLANPPTFQEHAQWAVDTEYETALNVFFKERHIDPKVFKQQLDELSNMGYKSPVAGKVSVIGNDQVPASMVHLVERCAQEMGCFDQIELSEKKYDEHGDMVTIDVFENGKSWSKLFLDLAQTAQWSTDLQQISIKHELAHIQKKHSLITDLIRKQAIQNDQLYARVQQSQEKQADIYALLTNITLTLAAQKSMFCSFSAPSGQLVSTMLPKKIDTISVKRKYNADKTEVAYHVTINSNSIWLFGPIGTAKTDEHPHPLERIAYMDDLKRAWDKHVAQSHKSAMPQSSQSS